MIPQHLGETIAEQSKNYRYSTNHQVVIDADTLLVVLVGNTTVIADGGYRGTGLIIPHRRERGQRDLPAWKEEHNRSHKQVRKPRSARLRPKRPEDHLRDNS